MNRFFQALLIGSTLGFSWFGMMAVHESGHVLGAWLTGGKVARVVLNPAEFSRTEFSRNPHPLAVAWGGPIWGSIFPTTAWLLVLAARRRWVYLARFFAGFCLIANGAYLLGGAATSAGDARDLLHHGAEIWQLVAFGLGACALGLWLWNGLGRPFGLGRDAPPVNRRMAVVVAMALAGLLALEVMFAA